MIGKHGAAVQGTEQRPHDTAIGIGITPTRHDLVQSLHRRGLPQEKHKRIRESVVNVVVAIVHLYGGPHCLDQKIASCQYSIGYGSSSTYPLTAIRPAPGVLVRTANPSPGLRVCGANKNA